jgi:hypothetical protein
MPYTPPTTPSPTSSTSTNHFPQQFPPSKRPTLTRNPPHTASTAISSLFDLDPASIGVASTSSLSLPLPPPSPYQEPSAAQAPSLRTTRRQTPTNHSPRPRSGHLFPPPALGKANTRPRGGYFDMSTSGEYTSPAMHIKNDDPSSSSSNDPTPSRFAFELHTHKKHHTWPLPLLSLIPMSCPSQVPYAHRISRFIQHPSRETEDGVEDMWSQMRERIVGKVGERNGDLERTREWMGRYEVEVEGG